MSTPNSQNRHSAAALIAFALPALGFLAVRFFMPITRPVNANAAAVTATLPTDAPAASPGPTDIDRELLRTFHAAEVEAPSRLTAGISAARAAEKPAPTPRLGHELPTGIALSSVMKTPGGTVAVIQGKLYRVGDKVTPEWSVTAIDDKSLTASLKHESGDSRVLTISR